jgi:cbb3-type cytochrome oxidase subunit 3
MRRRFALYVLASLALLVIDAFTPLETVEWMLHVLLVWLVSVACTPRQLVGAGIISSLCIAIGSVLAGPRYLPHWVLLTNRAVVIGTIWIIVYYSRQQKAAQDRERMAWLALQESQQEIKTLRGLIPICAGCKRIRTDDGIWQQIEVYILEHSDAEFSHDICAECMKTLYPGFPA